MTCCDMTVLHHRVSRWRLVALALLAVASAAGALAASAAPSAAPAPATTRYVTEQGWGNLSLTANRFELLAMGANGHSCTLDGPRNGVRGDAGEGCEVQFTPLPGGQLKVAPAAATMDAACRMFCGMRAGFEGIYHPMPAGCSDDERTARREAGLNAYRAGRHGEAAARWAALAEACGPYLHWTEADPLSNDRAVAAYHLGRFDECVALSRPVADDERLQMYHQTAPTDYDVLLPLHRAARFNLQRCAGKAARSTTP